MKVVESAVEKTDKVEIIEVTYNHINESSLIPAIQKLMNAPITPMYPTGYWVGKTCKKFLKKIEEIQKEFQKLLSEYCEKDENGQNKWAGPREPKILEGKQEEFNAKEKAFFEQVASIETMKFDLSQLFSAKLTPGDIMALEPLLNIQS